MTKIQPQSPLAVANFVIEIAKKNSMNITNLQLQKVLFFLQGYCLSEYGSPLIDGSFSKWKYGPVMEEVYREFKQYGPAYISNEVNFLVEDDGKVNLVTPEIKDQISKDLKEKFIENIKMLLSINPWKLVGLTHSDDSWKDYEKEINSYKELTYSEDEIQKCYENSVEKIELLSR